MRVISGKYKGRHFDVPRNFKARPTTDFAKENLFNILNNMVDFEEAAVLDFFAGTGSISLEFLSRGCKAVTSVEMDAMHAAHLKKTCTALGDEAWSVVRDDVFRYIRRSPAAYDLVFADPPYALKELSTIPDLVLGGNLLKPGGMLVFEHRKDNAFREHPRFIRHIAYRSVNIRFFEKK